jgi:hypothetical protein
MQKLYDKGACRGSDPGDYFDNFLSMTKPQKVALIARCDSCIVKQECHDYAVKHKCEGIWAGKEFKNGKPYNALRARRNINDGALEEIKIA